MNEWTISYAILCIIMLMAISSSWSGWRRLLWGRVLAWLGAAAILSLVAWSLLACTAYPLLSSLDTPRSALELGGCIVGSGFWAFFVIVFALPFYVLALTWYGLRLGVESSGKQSIIRWSSVLSLPPALCLLYGHLDSSATGIVAKLSPGLTPALLGYVTAYLGLTVPRLIVPSLQEGRLVRSDVA